VTLNSWLSSVQVSFSADNFNQDQQYDLGFAYLFERGGKRQRRLQAARDETEVTRFQVRDAERNLAFSVEQQFIAALLAKANLDFAMQNLESFRRTVEISETRHQAGDISEGDLLRIKVQLLQFETDVSAARVALQQAVVTLRQLIGFDAVAADYHCRRSGLLATYRKPGTSASHRAPEAARPCCRETEHGCHS
jgi:cobalt-zinc-cadmium efflux system outer membrane protein